MSPVPPTAQRRLAIIADDLTGATDASVPFAEAGFSTRVLLDRRKLHSLDSEILALTTNSRHDRPAEARRKVREACRFLQRHGVRLLYKKMDSTVQGNIVAEIQAAREAGGFHTVMFCPANPSQGRVVRHGWLKVRGRRFTQLDSHLETQGLGEHVPLGLPINRDKVSKLLAEGSAFIIADAESDRDISILVRAALDAPQPVLLAGSAGMARQLAKLFGATRTTASPVLTESVSRTRLSGPPVILCGSNNPLTQRQIVALLWKPGPVHCPLTRNTGRTIRPVVLSGHAAVVQVPIHRQPEARLRAHLALLSPLLQAGDIGSLLLTGGDTALLACRWLRPQAINLQGELLPGVPWGVLVGGLADGLAVCTKPGGFGNTCTLVQAVELLWPARV